MRCSENFRKPVNRRRLMPEQTTTLHGVFIDVFGVGVLLTGKSGIGKSELALGLINRGHRLIADDSVIFTRKKDSVVGYCPKILQDFLEVRGLGILDIRAMFGDTAIQKSKPLQLIVEVIISTGQDLQDIDRLRGVHCLKPVLGCEVSQVTIPVAPGRHLAVLVEAAVRNQVLKLNGYDASRALEKRQQEYLSATSHVTDSNK
jgi:HPr kinase/phosphorylase